MYPMSVVSVEQHHGSARPSMVATSTASAMDGILPSNVKAHSPTRTDVTECTGSTCPCLPRSGLRRVTRMSSVGVARERPGSLGGGSGGRRKSRDEVYRMSTSTRGPDSKIRVSTKTADYSVSSKDKRRISIAPIEIVPQSLTSSTDKPHNRPCKILSPGHPIYYFTPDGQVAKVIHPGEAADSPHVDGNEQKSLEEEDPDIFKSFSNICQEGGAPISFSTHSRAQDTVKTDPGDSAPLKSLDLDRRVQSDSKVTYRNQPLPEGRDKRLVENHGVESCPRKTLGDRRKGCNVQLGSGSQIRKKANRPAVWRIKGIYSERHAEMHNVLTEKNDEGDIFVSPSLRSAKDSRSAQAMPNEHDLRKKKRGSLEAIAKRSNPCGKASRRAKTDGDGPTSSMKRVKNHVVRDRENNRRSGTDKTSTDPRESASKRKTHENRENRQTLSRDDKGHQENEENFGEVVSVISQLDSSESDGDSDAIDTPAECIRNRIRERGTRKISSNSLKKSVRISSDVDTRQIDDSLPELEHALGTCKAGGDELKPLKMHQKVDVVTNTSDEDSGWKSAKANAVDPASSTGEPMSVGLNSAKNSKWNIAPNSRSVETQTTKTSGTQTMLHGEESPERPTTVLSKTRPTLDTEISALEGGDEAADMALGERSAQISNTGMGDSPSKLSHRKSNTRCRNTSSGKDKGVKKAAEFRRREECGRWQARTAQQLVEELEDCKCPTRKQTGAMMVKGPRRTRGSMYRENLRHMTSLKLPGDTDSESSDRNEDDRTVDVKPEQMLGAMEEMKDTQWFYNSDVVQDEDGDDLEISRNDNAGKPGKPPPPGKGKPAPAAGKGGRGGGSAAGKGKPPPAKGGGPGSSGDKKASVKSNDIKATPPDKKSEAPPPGKRGKPPPKEGRGEGRGGHGGRRRPSEKGRGGGGPPGKKPSPHRRGSSPEKPSSESEVQSDAKFVDVEEESKVATPEDMPGENDALGGSPSPIRRNRTSLDEVEVKETDSINSTPPTANPDRLWAHGERIPSQDKIHVTDDKPEKEGARPSRVNYLPDDRKSLDKGIYASSRDKEKAEDRHHRKPGPNPGRGKAGAPPGRGRAKGGDEGSGEEGTGTSLGEPSVSNVSKLGKQPSRTASQPASAASKPTDVDSKGPGRGRDKDEEARGPYYGGQNRAPDGGGWGAGKGQYDKKLDPPGVVIFQLAARFATFGGIRVSGGVRVLMDAPEKMGYVQIISPLGQPFITHYVNTLNFLHSSSAAGVAWSAVVWEPPGSRGSNTDMNNGALDKEDIPGRVDSAQVIFCEPYQAHRFRAVLETVRAAFCGGDGAVVTPNVPPFNPCCPPNPCPNPFVIPCGSNTGPCSVPANPCCPTPAFDPCCPNPCPPAPFSTPQPLPYPPPRTDGCPTVCAPSCPPPVCPTPFCSNMACPPCPAPNPCCPTPNPCCGGTSCNTNLCQGDEDPYAYTNAYGKTLFCQRACMVKLGRDEVWQEMHRGCLMVIQEPCCMGYSLVMVNEQQVVVAIQKLSRKTEFKPSLTTQYGFYYNAVTTTEKGSLHENFLVSFQCKSHEEQFKCVTANCRRIMQMTSSHDHSNSNMGPAGAQGETVGCGAGGALKQCLGPTSGKIGRPMKDQGGEGCTPLPGDGGGGFSGMPGTARGGCGGGFGEAGGAIGGDCQTLDGREQESRNRSNFYPKSERSYLQFNNHNAINFSENSSAAVSGYFREFGPLFSGNAANTSSYTDTCSQSSVSPEYR